MTTALSDPAYIAAWISRKKAHDVLGKVMKAYRRHLEQHKCESGLFTDVA